MTSYPERYVTMSGGKSPRQLLALMVSWGSCQRAQPIKNLMVNFGFIVNQTIASNPNRKKYLSSIGINTYSPLVDKFVMNINGPVYMSNGEINTMISSNFEIFNMHFS